MAQNPLAAFVAKNPGNALVPLLSDTQGALLDSARHGAYYEASKAGTLFIGANQTGVTTSAGLATTFVGLCLSNPAGSGKNLVLSRVSAQFIVAPSTVTGIGLITGYAAGGVTVHTTALTPINSVIGTGSAGVGLLDSACTLVGTPVWSRYLTETANATTLPFVTHDLAGAFILPPGAYAAIGTTIAGPASGFVGSMEWEELPV